MFNKFQLIIILLIPFAILAQDERIFRDLFKTDFSLDSSARSNLNKQYKWTVNGPLYEIDINGNGDLEGVLYEKKDGEDWLHIYNSFRVPIFSTKLQAFGKDSSLYKIQLRSLSNQAKVLIVYYYEGNNSYLHFSGQTRLYFLTIDNNELKSISLYKGPIVESEQRQRDRNYQYSSYSIELFDYNQDSLKEIVVKYNTLSKVYMYIGKGEWKTF